MKKLILFWCIALFILLLPWMIISFFVRGEIWNSPSEIPHSKYAIVLGTSPWINGSNLYFSTRIEATKELYEQWKIEYIIVSWDNSNHNYNEPLYMKNALVRAWIPENIITMDFAGFRTLDSVIRAKEVFSIHNSVTFISQPFHLERALFIAKVHGIDAIGYSAANVSLRYGPMPYFREIWARWLALYDIIIDRKATVLGEKVEVETAL